MKCPFCFHLESKVLETRDSEDWETTRRRRECLKCEKRFTTYERVENSPLTVVKKDGKREVFSRDKLKLGLYKACEKTVVKSNDIEKIVDEVERELRLEDRTEVESRKIGNLVAKQLKKIDKIAYIRFASVFKRFVDVEEFEKEVKKLL
ncbi:MAG: Transcriptional repressor NrdR [Candidatus Levybacteria bacterium GW2011_GWA2_40_8]|nr:MAG: Transcriptional repressor NrdR [Candidatus Levybacteria bacterium GW2011_GWA2_40_8]